MKVYTVPMLPNEPVMNTNITSSPFQLKYIWGFAIQVVFTGTPTGTFSLQASCDKANDQIGASISNDYQPTNWSTIVNSSFAVSAPGSYMWNIPDTAYNWVRLIYTDTSGGSSTAVLTSAILNTKGV